MLSTIRRFMTRLFSREDKRAEEVPVFDDPLERAFLRSFIRNESRWRAALKT